MDLKAHYYLSLLSGYIINRIFRMFIIIIMNGYHVIVNLCDLFLTAITNTPYASNLSLQSRANTLPKYNL